MARKRAPENDWICRRCGCPCEPPGRGAKHVGGGQGMRSCGKPADPVLRSVMESESAAVVAALKVRRG